MTGALVENMGFTRRGSDIFLAVAVIFIMLLLLIPFSGFALDVLISLSIVISVTTLLVTLYADEVLSFNSFPSFLLFLTLFRLALNIATTRMILTEAHAGQIIQTFGDVVTGGNAFVGFLIFTLLTGVNFIVITKGSGRVAEVAARFTLDSLPGKQLSIDADVNAGLIDEMEAKRRREKIMVEADFYGAMDGASKFVRGDAIAGIIITIVNIVGGFIVGMLIHGMSWIEVVRVYVTLTVGDGLVTQIPALLVSVGAGIIVTRSSSRENLAEVFRRQLFNNPRVLYITATILVLLSLIPGMPILVMTPIAITIYLYAYYLSQNFPQWLPLERVSSEKESSADQKIQMRKSEESDNVLFIDPMEIELGHALTSIVDERLSGNLLKRISLIRRQIATELGIVVPSIRIHDNMAINPQSYVIKIKNDEVASGILRLDQYLAMNPGDVKQTIEGIETVEPAFGLPAIWIKADQKNRAVSYGYIVADPLSVLATHLTEVIRSHAHELLNRQEVAKLVENAKEYASAVINELIPLKVNLGQILKVLQNLLRERISIRDIVTILEILADHSATTTDPDLLSEYVRQRLARAISKQCVSIDKSIHVITLDPKVEQLLLESIQMNELGKNIILHPVTIRKIINETKLYIQRAAKEGVKPVFLTTASLRPYFKKLIERNFTRLPVLSLYEIVPDIQVYTLGVVSMDVLAH
jgi:flagellar biosynthesis protein FlhA